MLELSQIISYNWEKSIPELLVDLKPYNIGVNEFFKLERNITFKFTSLMKDLNSLQKEILKNKNYDISKFISSCSQAFLPKVVFQLEEYGLPRMVSKKIHHSNIINFLDKELTIHSVIVIFNEIGLPNLIERTNDLEEFDIYLLEYFYNGIETNKK